MSIKKWKEKQQINNFKYSFKKAKSDAFLYKKNFRMNIMIWFCYCCAVKEFPAHFGNYCDVWEEMQCMAQSKHFQCEKCKMNVSRCLRFHSHLSSTRQRKNYINFKLFIFNCSLKQAITHIRRNWGFSGLKLPLSGGRISNMWVCLWKAD